MIKIGEYHYVITMLTKVIRSNLDVTIYSDGTFDITKEATRAEVFKDVVAIVNKQARESSPEPIEEAHIALFFSLELN